MTVEKTELIVLPDGRKARTLEPGEMILIGDLYGDVAGKLREYVQKDRDDWGMRTAGEEGMATFYRCAAGDAEKEVQKSHLTLASRWESRCINCNEIRMVGMTTMCDSCATVLGL